jgi:Zn finger protein HypA/HybF involved in hydrogenase expression
VKPNPRCPKCKSRNLTLEEVSSVGMQFHVCEDGTIRRVYGAGKDYDIDHVDATCGDCRHTWRLRGLIHVGQLEGYEPSRELDVNGEQRCCDCRRRSSEGAPADPRRPPKGA